MAATVHKKNVESEKRIAVSGIKPFQPLRDDDEVTFLSFNDAVTALTEGKQLSRKGWDGRAVIVMRRPRNASGILNHLYAVLRGGESRPWSPGAVDMNAADWYVTA